MQQATIGSTMVSDHPVPRTEGCAVEAGRVRFARPWGRARPVAFGHAQHCVSRLGKGWRNGKQRKECLSRHLGRPRVPLLTLCQLLGPVTYDLTVEMGSVFSSCWLVPHHLCKVDVSFNGCATGTSRLRPSPLVRTSLPSLGIWRVRRVWGRGQKANLVCPFPPCLSLAPSVYAVRNHSGCSGRHLAFTPTAFMPLFGGSAEEGHHGG